MTATAADVAKYILEKSGRMSTLKLQKLVYYCQAYSLAWTSAPMFSEKIRAWAHGPVVYELLEQHRGHFSVSADEIDGDCAQLSDQSKAIAGAVIDDLGSLTGWELRNRTHEERPWCEAFAPGDLHHHREIPQESLRGYYAT